MSNHLLPCPFCGGQVKITSTRDWHKLTGYHTRDCVFDDDYVTMVPANNGSMEWLVAAWNRRHAAPVPAAAPGPGKLVCPQCGVDRLVSPCPGMADECAMRGDAHLLAAAPVGGSQP